MKIGKYSGRQMEEQTGLHQIIGQTSLYGVSFVSQNNGVVVGEVWYEF